MANIKKSFNFRNGVQVDDDNLKVSSTGLVGIGTTVPTEALDVRGNLVVSGVSSAATIQAGVLTVTTFNPTSIIGAGISVVSGVVTASSGIVTYYGDARFLQGMPTSQWVDTNTGLGVSSIYNTGGNVGIATSNPQFTLQIGENPNQIAGVSGDGVGISSSGDIKASGIITASTFVGNLSGTVTGSIIGVAASATQLQTARTIGGVLFDGTSNIDLAGVNIAGNQNTSGTAANLSGTPNISVGTLSASTGTFSSNVDVTGDLDVNGHTDLDNVSISGVTTSSGNINLPDNVNLQFGDSQDLKIYHGIVGGHSYIENTTGSLRLKNGGSTAIEIANDGTTAVNNLTVTQGVNVTGIITATTELNSPLIGVGTDAPANDIQVRKGGNVEIQVTSDSGIAGLTVGREAGTSNTNNAEFRYGGGAGANYSSAQSLDILNYGTGNFNYHISANNAGNVDGDFHWHKGLNNTRLMTLTGVGGSLGIGITTPSTPLHVLGSATISGNVNLGGDLTGDVVGNVTGNLTGTLTGNVNAVSGVSTFKRLDLDESFYYEFGELSAAGVGIGTTMGNFKLVVNDDADKKFIITDSGNVGIKTDDLNGNALFVNGAIAALDPIGIGTNEPRAAVDFADAGKATTGLAANRMFMIPPKVTSSQRGNLLSLVSGALVYDTDSNNIQIYNGSAWSALGSGGGGGGGEANQNAFHQIAVTGQSAIIADSTMDTVIFQNGSGISLTSNATTDTLTFSATSDSSLGVVYAKHYGLDASKTDGTNVTAINNAIAALGDDGGTIFFPGGQFYLNASIDITRANATNSIRFVGSGHQNYGGDPTQNKSATPPVYGDVGGTVLRRDADDEFFNITNSRAIHFVGITFKGGAANGNGGNSGISGGNGAIYVLADAGCQGYLIENCVFHGIANCIHFKGLSDSIIRGCRFRNVPSNEGNGACIKLDENGSEVIDQIRIQDCVIDGSPDGSAINTAIDGIAIYNTVSTVYVTNTSAIRLRRSFYSDGNWDGNFFYFQNSEAERANEDGFSINGTGNFVTIDNCFSCTNGQGGTGHGINIGSSQNSSLNITNPNVRDNSGHGILINGPTNNCSIVNPAIGGNSRGSSGTNHGVVISTNTNNVYITGGKIGGNTDELAGTGTQGRGILIDGATHNNIRIIGTNVTGNQNAEGISQNISSGTGNSVQFNAGSTVAIDT